MANPTVQVQQVNVIFSDETRYWPIANTSTTFYPGEMIGLNSSGQATHFDDSAALRFLGIFDGPEFVVDSTVPSAMLFLRVRKPKFFSMPASSGTPSRLTDIGKVAYAVNSGQVTLSSGTLVNYNVAGVVEDIYVTKATDTTGTTAQGWYLKPKDQAPVSGGNFPYRAPVGTTAAAGSTQGDAAALAEGFNLVTAANGTKGVILPTSMPGISVKISSTVGSILKVYPPTGSTINALASNTALSVNSSAACEFLCYSSSAWYSIPEVPS